MLYYLLPPFFKKLGWMLFVLTVGTASCRMTAAGGDFIVPEYLILFCGILSLFLVFFSREKGESDFLTDLRVQTMLSSFFVNTCLLLIAILLCGDSWNLFYVLYGNTISFFVIYYIILFLKKIAGRRV